MEEKNGKTIYLAEKFKHVSPATEMVFDNMWYFIQMYPHGPIRHIGKRFGRYLWKKNQIK